MTLAEAAAQADAFAEEGTEQELAKLRSEWDELLEASERGADYRERAVGYSAIGQFRFRAKTELLRRGLEDESPACAARRSSRSSDSRATIQATSTTCGRCCTRSSPTTRTKPCGGSPSSA